MVSSPVDFLFVNTFRMLVNYVHRDTEYAPPVAIKVKKYPIIGLRVMAAHRFKYVHI